MQDVDVNKRFRKSVGRATLASQSAARRIAVDRGE
jgi:hypothetical protein